MNKQLFSILSIIFIGSLSLTAAELQQQMPTAPANLDLMPANMCIDIGDGLKLYGNNYPNFYAAWKTASGTFEGTYENSDRTKFQLTPEQAKIVFTYMRKLFLVQAPKYTGPIVTMPTDDLAILPEVNNTAAETQDRSAERSDCALI